MASSSSSSNSDEENKNKNERKLLSETLAGIITANGFFTAAVFVGITGTVTPSASIPRHCIPGDDIVQSLFLFEVLSFSFYLVSSLVAQGMKLSIARLEAIDPKRTKTLAVAQLRTRFDGEDMDEEETNELQHYPYSFPAPAGSASTVMVETWAAVGRDDDKPVWGLRSMMRVSAVLSLVGSFFLMLSMVDVIQLKLGLLSCGGTMAVGAVLALTLVVLAGIIVYGVTVFVSLDKIAGYEK